MQLSTFIPLLHERVAGHRLMLQVRDSRRGPRHTIVLRILALDLCRNDNRYAIPGPQDRLQPDQLDHCE